jgi:hypothetical protein
MVAGPKDAGTFAPFEPSKGGAAAADPVRLEPEVSKRAAGGADLVRLEPEVSKRAAAGRLGRHRGPVGKTA